MNDEELGRPDLLDDEAPTLIPDAPAPASKWEMPKPVFRKTSGYLPQGFERQLTAVADSSAEPSPVPGNEGPSTAVDVEPQPEIPEVPADSGPLAEPAAVKQRSPAAAALIALAIVAVIGIFVSLFLAAVYYFFLRPGANGNF